jgi:hypothetical protein
MINDSPVNAILNPPQLDTFLKRFDLSLNELKPNFSGWGKLVIETEDAVFLFPRNPDTAVMLERELEIYDFFRSLKNPQLPFLVEKVRDEDISYYEFGVIRKAKGLPFSRFITQLNDSELQNFLVKLTEVMVIWHGVDIGNLPEGIDYFRNKDDSEEITIDSWSQKALSSETLDRAIDFFWFQTSTFMGHEGSKLGKIQLQANLKSTLSELASIDPVLIHGDLHEDQIFVSPQNIETITGIIDWGSVKIDHPIWDFNFAEWGLEIWEQRDHFVSFREAMWETYLNKRGIKGVSPGSLHLFYVLQEILLSIQQKDKETVGFTGKVFEETMRIYLGELMELILK